MKKTILIAILSLITLSGVFGQTTAYRTHTNSITPSTVCVGSTITLSFYVIDSLTNLPPTMSPSAGSTYKVFIGSTSSSVNASVPVVGASISWTSWYTSATPGTISVTIPSESNGTYYLFVKCSAIPISNSSHPIVSVLNASSAPTISTSGSTALCPSSTIILTASGSGPYSWSPGGATTSSITVSSPATYSVSTTNSCGTVTSSGTTVTSLSLPTAVIDAATDTTFCQGGSVMLHATLTNSTSNMWSNSSTTTNISVSTSGVYYTIATNSCGVDTSNSITVLVNPNPTAPVISRPAGTDSLLSNYSIGNSWSPVSSTNNYFVPTSNGVYTVTYTDVNGCSSTSAPFNFTLLASGVVENNVSEMTSKFYPVPTTDVLNIELQNIETNNMSAKIVVNVYSVDGKKVLSNEYDNSDKIAINVADVKPGVYSVEVIVGNSKLSKNIAVVH